MGARSLRLWLPAVAFVLVATIARVGQGTTWLVVRGGATTTGIFGIAFALALAVLLVSAVDETRRDSFWDLGRSFPESAHRLTDISRRPLSFRRALVEMYSWPLLPIALLSAGFGVLLSILLHGLLTPSNGVDVSPVLAGNVYASPTEIAMGVWLAIGCAWLVWRGRRAALIGFVVGTGTATILGESAFDVYFYLDVTLQGWGITAGVALLLGLPVATWRRRRQLRESRGVD